VREHHHIEQRIKQNHKRGWWHELTARHCSTVASLIYLQQISLLRSLLLRRNRHNPMLVRWNKEQKISALRWNLCWAADSTWNCQWNDSDEKWIELEMLGKHTACTGACLEFLAVISFTFSLMHPQKKKYATVWVHKKKVRSPSHMIVYTQKCKKKKNENDAFDRGITRGKN